MGSRWEGNRGGERRGAGGVDVGEEVIFEVGLDENGVLEGEEVSPVGCVVQRGWMAVPRWLHYGR